MIYDFAVARADGTPLPLSDLRGRVLLLVSTASRCGYTPQYAGLEELHRTLGPAGLSVLAFPCNQFGGQEPDGADEIAAFCKTTYAVTFPVLAKVDVSGPDADPLFAFLAHERPGLFGTRAIKWNFTKFLVDRSGSVVGRFGSRTIPASLAGRIRSLL